MTLTMHDGGVPLPMRPIAFVLLAAVALAGMAADIAPVSGQADGEAAPIYGVTIPAGYRDWHLISVKRLTDAGESSSSCAPNWAMMLR